MTAFACPPECARCCSHLERPQEPEDEEFRAILREHGVYSCSDAPRTGLSLTNAEAAALGAEASRRGLDARLHPRTFLLESRRRLVVALDWHMPRSVCPFLDGYRCTVYDARPLVCRAYPVVGLGRTAAALAPECPEMPVAASALRVERRARRAVEAAHARLDELGARLLDAPGARFAKALAPREAARRARAWRVVAAEDFVVRAEG